MKYKELEMKPVKEHLDKRWETKHKLVARFAHGKIVDLGCGWYTNPYLKDAIGVDLEKIETPGNYKEMIQADLNGRLPFPNESFDTVIASGVIEHLYNYHGFLMECRRILRGGGTLVINTPNRTINQLIARKNMLHIQEWSYTEFVQLLEHFFNFKKAYGLIFIMPIIRKEINLGKFPRLSHDVVYVCKKPIGGIQMRHEKQ